jgi:hypothetical protein
MASPARTFWTLQLGSHAITVKAVDEQGKLIAGEPVRIEVTQ